MNKLKVLLLAYDFLRLMGYSRLGQIEGVWTGSCIDCCLAVHQRRQNTTSMLFNFHCEMHSSAKWATRWRGDRSVPIFRLTSFHVLMEQRDFWSEALLEILSTPQRASATPTNEAPGPSNRKKRLNEERRIEHKNKDRVFRRQQQAIVATAKKSTSSQALLAKRDNRNSTALPRRDPDGQLNAMFNLGPTRRRWKFWNNSCGCHSSNCGFGHTCLECGGDDRWVGRHSGK